MADEMMDNTNAPVASTNPAEAQAAPTQGTPDSPDMQGMQPEGQPQAPQGQPQAPQAAQADTDGMSPEEQAMMPKGAPQGKQQQNQGGIFHSLMETLAGPSFQYRVNANTGEMERVPVQRKTSQLANSIVAGALTGLFSGIGKKNLAQGASAGFGANVERIDKQKQDAQGMAKEDFGRHASVLETNLRVHQNQLQLSRMDYDMHKQIVSDYTDIYKGLHDIPGALIAEGVPEHELGKYNFTKQNGIPIGVVPSLDDKGNQLKNEDGSDKFENLYAIVDPEAKLELSARDRATAVEYGLEGYTNKDKDGKTVPVNLPSNVTMKARTYINTVARIQSIRQAQSDLDSFQKFMNDKEDKPTKYKEPEIKDKTIQTKVDAAAEKYGVPKGLARGMVKQESGGKQGVVSPKGATGVLQLMPSTFKNLIDPETGKPFTDITNVDQNIRAGLVYMKQQLDKYKKPELALAAYNAGPGAVDAAGGKVPNYPETQDYVKNIMANIQPDEEPEKETPSDKFDLKKAIQEDPSLLKALQARYNQGLVGLTPDKAVEAMAKNPETAPYAGKIAQLYGGPQQLQAYTSKVMASQKLDAERATLQAKSEDKLKEQAADRKAKQAEMLPEDDKLSQALADGNMVALDKVVSMRSDRRARIYDMALEKNPNFNPEETDNKINVWKDWNTSRGKPFQQKLSANVLFDHIGDAIEANDNYKRKMGAENTDLAAKPMNWWTQHVENDPVLMKLRAAIEPVKDEFMTFLQNNHALTESDKKTGNLLLSDTLTPAYLEGALKQFAKTAAIRLKETDEMGWKPAFGDNFPALLSPSMVDNIRKMNDPEIYEILKDSKSGGTMKGDATGKGSGGKRLSELLVPKNGPNGSYLERAPEGQSAQPQAAPQTEFYNPTTKQTIKWNGQAYVDVKTGQPVGQ